MRARAFAALIVACGCDAEVEPDGAPTSHEVNSLDAEAAPAGPDAAPAPIIMKTHDPEAVPAEPAAIRAWLQAFAYREWQAQSPVHPTGEHGGARVFFNAALARSMAAGASEHPIGAAGVRELYESDLTTLRGFALMVKTGPSGQDGGGWFWLEMFGTTDEARPLVAEHGSRGCVGCHAAGVDFVHPPERP